MSNKPYEEIISSFEEISNSYVTIKLVDEKGDDRGLLKVRKEKVRYDEEGKVFSYRI